MHAWFMKIPWELQSRSLNETSLIVNAKKQMPPGKKYQEPGNTHGPQADLKLITNTKTNQGVMFCQA